MSRRAFAGQARAALSGPPTAEDAERAIVGCVLTYPEASLAVADLDPDRFYSAELASALAACQAVYRDGRAVDLLSVSAELQKAGPLGEGGRPNGYELAQLTMAGNVAAVPAYIEAVKDAALRRDVFAALTPRIAACFEPNADPFDEMDAAQAALFALSEAGDHRAVRPLSEPLGDCVKHLEAVHGNETGVVGIPSGIRALDALTGGWRGGELIIVAARPSMGKSSLGFLFATAAAEAGTAAYLATLEMAADKCGQRIVSGLAGVDGQAMRTGRMNDAQWAAITRQAGRISPLPILVDDESALSPRRLRARVAAAKAARRKDEAPLGLVIVDYLQLMVPDAEEEDGARRRSSNREQEVAAISRSLKALALEEDVAVIALAQLSRAVDTRGGDHRPQLSDLRESGGLEQDADVVTFVYRAERYGIKVDEFGESTEGLGELLVEKQRNGPVGVVPVAYRRDTSWFSDAPSRSERRAADRPAAEPEPVPPPAAPTGLSLVKPPSTPLPQGRNWWDDLP